MTTRASTCATTPRACGRLDARARSIRHRNRASPFVARAVNAGETSGAATGASDGDDDGKPASPALESEVRRVMRCDVDAMVWDLWGRSWSCSSRLASSKKRRVGWDRARSIDRLGTLSRKTDARETAVGSFVDRWVSITRRSELCSRPVSGKRRMMNTAD